MTATNSTRYSFIPSTLTTYKMLVDRTSNMKKYLGYSDRIAKKIYTNMDSYQADNSLQGCAINEGGIFNLEFNLDGRILVGACEKKSVLIFDASNQKQIKKITDAHNACVNSTRFLDENTFATCSDDNTVKIWDLRQLNAAKQILCGHSSWVKDIEYLEKDQKLITSALDGSIYVWDLKNLTGDMLFDNVLKVRGLMRTKLTQDGSKMIICTTSGYIIIIHNLDLATLGNNLKEFYPNRYRLMQSNGQVFPKEKYFNHLFYQTPKHNRIEFIGDFPDDVGVIYSVQIHPMGWVAISRNINANENEEWTAVHDIQTRDPNDYREAFSIDDAIPDVEDADILEAARLSSRPADAGTSVITNDRQGEMRFYDGQPGVFTDPPTFSIHSGLIDHNQSRRQLGMENRKIINNIPRLTHFAQEKRVGEGYIKELCFSKDGRIICSPFDKGVRLLGFDQHMQELCYCVPTQPRELFTIAEMDNYHTDVVVSCKFNPIHYQLVSGCLNGNIIWYKPIL